MLLLLRVQGGGQHRGALHATVCVVVLFLRVQGGQLRGARNATARGGGQLTGARYATAWGGGAAAAPAPRVAAQWTQAGFWPDRRGDISKKEQANIIVKGLKY